MVSGQIEQISRGIFQRSLWKQSVCFSSRQANKIDRSKVPKLDERDLQEHYVSGSGPGGQNVNKAVNCCVLKHMPTGLVVKVHHSRELEQNRTIAREMMISKLDNMINGENSVESQKRRIAMKKLAARDAHREKMKALKEEYKRKFGKDKEPHSVDGDTSQ